MKFIKTFDELKSLPNSTKVHKFIKGHAHVFIIVGTIRQSTGLIVANDASLKDLTFIHERDFKEKTFSLDYNDKEAGELMIEQIKAMAAKEIEDITEVYLNGK